MERVRTKAEVDLELWQEALSLDRDISEARVRTDHELHPDGLSHALVPIRPLGNALKLLPAALSHQERNNTAFVPLPDGSTYTFTQLRMFACSGLPFDQVVDHLHYFGTKGRLEEMLSPMSVVRLVQNGIKPDDIPGKHRRLTTGFEYGIFNSSHPDLIDSEMKALGEKSGDLAKVIKEGCDVQVDFDDLRDRLAATRFCDETRVSQFSNRELLAHLGASETQRIIAYIHPWYERVGRTSEEGRAVFSLRCGVNPLLLSQAENRSTIEGYERGIILGVTAVALLREVGRRLGLTENQVKNINKTHDLYNQLSALPGIKRRIYNSPLQYAYGRNIFPDEDVMKRYYQETHNIIMGLINSMDLPTLTRDPHAVYLTGHLIGRGKTIKF